MFISLTFHSKVKSYSNSFEHNDVIIWLNKASLSGGIGLIIGSGIA